MSKTEVIKSTIWTFKMIGKAFLGVLWLLGPSLIIYNIGPFLMPYTGWTREMISLAATNAFVIWVSVQILLIVFDRYMRIMIRSGIESYHIEYIELKKRWNRITGTPGDLETIKTLKQKLAK